MTTTLRAGFEAGRLTCCAGHFSLGPGAPALQIDGKTHRLRAAPVGEGEAIWRGAQVELVQKLVREVGKRVRVTSLLRHRGRVALTLNHVTLFATRRTGLGPGAARVRVLEQNAYTGRVRTLRQMATGSDGLKSLDGAAGGFVSQNHTVLYCPTTRTALLIGFETVDRWLPQISARMFPPAGEVSAGMANVDGGAPVESVGGAPLVADGRAPAFRELVVEFDGGDYRLEPGEELKLGEFVLAAGSDPLALLDAHGRRIKSRNGLADPIGPLANWCSWYPYRLGVSEINVVATARAARERNLHKLGLRFIQVDLGWQKGDIPSYFEENERFGRGLPWLSVELRKLGFDLGVWVGVLCIADNHPVAREHPEWLLCGPDGKPHNNYNWFWDPFCPIYALDVSHPGAKAWLRENFTRLAEKGVRFVKWDFAGVVTGKDLRGRHDLRFVNARAREAVRTAFRIAKDALDSQGEEAVMIDCSGTDYAAAGIAQVSYANMDTGNTGLGWRHLREVYTSYACHLFKHHWALLQPSCLVTGLPGTLEEARIRATITFMGAGHVDLGDDLTGLPEDRWQVLLSALPPNDTPATPVDLFHPVGTGTLPYLQLIKAGEADPATDPASAIPAPVEDEPQGACVWSLPVRADWDDWHLVAVINWAEPPVEEGSGVRLARRFRVEFPRLGLPRRARYWAWEFWSGHFLGEVPRRPRPAGSYRHPGDFSHPILETALGVLDIGFHGPAVKLLVLRRPRPHPWPLGTTFHQSGGRELSDVRWDAPARTLSGRLHRPTGESGYIAVACPSATGVSTRRIPVVATGDVTDWSLQL